MNGEVCTASRASHAVHPYRPKHASAPVERFVVARAARSDPFRTSTGISYEPTAANTSDGSINRYYDPTTGQFLSVDPIVDVTEQPYAYVNGDPVNGSDPLGLGFWSDVAKVVTAPVRAEVRGASKVANFVVTHKKAIEIGAGIALGVAAAAAGVGAVIEAAGIASAVTAGATIAEASTGAIVAGLSATAAGSIATYLDSGACAGGNSAACVGRDLGAVGAATGLIATLGSGGLATGLWELGSLPDAIFQGLGAFSAMFGITASVSDLTTTAAGAVTLCGS